MNGNAENTRNVLIVPAPAISLEYAGDTTENCVRPFLRKQESIRKSTGFPLSREW